MGNWKPSSYLINRSGKGTASSLRKNSRFVSGHAFRHTASAALLIAPLGAVWLNSTSAAVCSVAPPRASKDSGFSL